MSDIPSQTPLRGQHAADQDLLDGYPDSYADSATVDQVDLSADPFADDLEAELAAAAPKRWYNRATYVLGALALLVGGFLAGVQVEKHYGAASSTTDARAAALAALANGGFARGAGRGAGGEGAGGGATAAPSPSSSTAPSETGTVKLVDGTTVYVGLASGDVLTVRTTATTKITVGTATKVSQLTVNESVTVTGPAPDSTGQMTATAITAGP